MLFAAGETITAGKLSRAQPTTYYATGTGTVAAGSSNADVPSATVPITTTMVNAIYVAHAVFDFDMTGAGTGTGNGKINVDSVNSTVLAAFAAEVTTDRATVAQTYRGTLAAAGAHTIKLVATTSANQTLNGIGCSLLVIVYEQS